MKPRLDIISGGMGSVEQLTERAKRAILECASVYAPPRLAEAFSELAPGIFSAGVDETITHLRRVPESGAAVIVSGDAGFYSLADRLCREFSGQYEIEIHSGISSLQALCARLRLPWDGVERLSVHGRDLRAVVGTVSYCNRVFLLAGGKNSASMILERLRDAGLGAVTAHVGGELGTPREKVVSGSAAELAELDFCALSALLVENPEPADPSRFPCDADFIRGKVPMSKDVVRATVRARLAPEPGDCVWDVGAGTGSVSVALAYAANRGEVYAVERSAPALDLIERNRRALGAFNVTPVSGDAPGALEPLPAPDKVFVGGSGGRLREILRLILRKNAAAQILVAAVTLETMRESLSCLEEFGLDDPRVENISVSEAKSVGGYRMMTAQNPVWLIGGRGRG